MINGCEFNVHCDATILDYLMAWVRNNWKVCEYREWDTAKFEALLGIKPLGVIYKKFRQLKLNHWQIHIRNLKGHL